MTSGKSCLSWYQASIWEPRPIFLLLSLIVFRQLQICWYERPLGWEVESVVFSFCRASPVQPFSSLSPMGLMSILYCLYFLDSPPNLEGQIPVFISPRNRISQLYPRALGCTWSINCEICITVWDLWFLMMNLYCITAYILVTIPFWFLLRKWRWTQHYGWLLLANIGLETHSVLMVSKHFQNHFLKLWVLTSSRFWRQCLTAKRLRCYLV
jgi:hypothetical protein